MKTFVIAGLGIVAALILALTVACREPAMETRASNNPNVPVELLFEHEGVRVYRFYDGGNARYYAVARTPKPTVTAEWVESCGKNCSRLVEIPTVTP